MEYIYGEIVIKATPRTIHNRIVDLVRECFPMADFARWSSQGIAITEQADRPDPDLTIASGDLADEFFKVVPSELVLFALEVVSPTSAHRDYEQKSKLYAQGRIPVCLIVDPGNGTWLLHSDPDRAAGEYRTTHKGVFGEPAHLPGPLGLTVPTDRFRLYPAG